MKRFKQYVLAAGLLPALLSNDALAAPSLVGAEFITDELVEFDLASGSSTLVSQLGPTSINLLGLASNSSPDFLYGIDSFGSGPQALVGITPSSGNFTTLATLSSPINSVITGLAFSPTTQTLFSIDVTLDELVSIDTATGVVTYIGPFGDEFDNFQDLAFDSSSGTLYSVDLQKDTLVTIDTGSGAATVVGSLGLVSNVDIFGLTFDPISGFIIGTDDLQDDLISIDPATAQSVILGSTGTSQVLSLAFVTIPEPSSAIALVVLLTSIHSRSKYY